MSWFRRRTPAPESARVAAVPDGLALCPYCGGLHVYRCPRVLSVRYYPSDDGESLGPLQEVIFDVELSRQLWDDVVWPEEPAQ